jgi:hypothetical protein
MGTQPTKRNAKRMIKSQEGKRPMSARVVCIMAQRRSVPRMLAGTWTRQTRKTHQPARFTTLLAGCGSVSRLRDLCSASGATQLGE